MRFSCAKVPFPQLQADHGAISPSQHVFTDRDSLKVHIAPKALDCALKDYPKMHRSTCTKCLSVRLILDIFENFWLTRPTNSEQLSQISEMCIVSQMLSNVTPEHMQTQCLTIILV